MATHVTSRQDDPAHLPTLRPPEFVGRERELDALAATLDEPPALVLVDGEAGIGKSRLLQEFFAGPWGSRHRSLVATCPPFREPYTLGPVVDALRQAADRVVELPLTALAGALRPLFPEWSADLPAAPEPAEDATASRHRLFRALVELLGCLQVAVLAVEDVHWADDATLDFLLFITTRRPQPLSLVLTYRAEDMPGDSALLRLSSRLPAGGAQLRLTLEPLDVAQTEALVSSMLSGASLSRQFVAFLHAHTEGVPLAVEESLRLMHQRADLARRDGAWVRRRLDDIVVPPTVRDAVLERAARLGTDAQQLVRAAAVLAEASAEATLLAVAGLAAERGRAGLAEAIGCGLLHEDARGLLAFRHALACKAVHEAIPAPQRRGMHQRAGDALQGIDPPPLVRLAHHFRSAGDTENWARYAEQAAERAIAAGDDVTADTLLHDLIISAQLPPRLVARLARTLPITSFGSHDRFHTLVRALRTLLDGDGLEPDVEAELRFQLARALIIMGSYATAKAELERAVAYLEPGSVQAARAMIFLGLPLGDVRPAEVHLEWLRRAEQVLPAVPEVDRLRLEVDRTTALLLLGEESGWDAARRLPHETEIAAQRRDIVTRHINVGHLAMMWGHYAESEQNLAQALRLAEAYRHDASWVLITTTQAHLRWLTGEWAGLADLVAGYADDEQVQRSTRSEAMLVVGLLAAAGGDAAAAEPRLRFAYDDGYQSKGVERFVEVAALLARLWLADGRVDAALGITDEPIEIALHKGIWVCATELVPVRVALLAVRERLAEAEQLIARYAQLLHGHGAPAPQGALILSRATLAAAQGRHAMAADLFGRAARAWQALPRPYDALLARERQAGCLLATGHDSDATAMLSDVFHGLSDLGARGDAVRVMHALRQHGIEVKRPWWGGRRGYGDQLSPRELDVARLLVGGRTNREIAAALYLSPKTVARHLDAAMRKLGATSRTALAVKLVDGGIVEAPARDVPTG